MLLSKGGFVVVRYSVPRWFHHRWTPRQKTEISLRRLSLRVDLQADALLRHRPWRVPVLTEGEDKYRAFSGERHNSGIRIRVAWLYRYSSKWLRGTLQATVSRNPHRRRTANMPLVFHSTGADGYDMDYTDSKSIRPRSWVRTGLVNCLRAPILWFCFLMAHASLLFGSIWSSVAFSSAAWKQNFWE